MAQFESVIVKYEDITPSSAGEGITRRIMAHSGTMMGVEVSFETGAVAATHTHPHEQFTLIVSGKFEYTEDGVTTVLKAGDSYYSKPNVHHGAVCLEAGVLIDVFTPQREDFLA